MSVILSEKSQEMLVACRQRLLSKLGVAGASICERTSFGTLRVPRQHPTPTPPPTMNIRGKHCKVI
jgi:hypothetical protein